MLFITVDATVKEPHHAISEMDLLTIGEINDMYTELNNDENSESYSQIDQQADFDKF